MAINKKDHYGKVEEIHSKLKLNDLGSLEDIVSSTRMKLHKELDSNFLFVDDKDTVNKLNNVVTKLEKSKSGSLLKEITERIAALKVTAADVKPVSGGGRGGGGNSGNAATYDNIMKEIRELDAFKAASQGEIDERYLEYNEIYANAKNFKFDDDAFQYAPGVNTETINIDDVAAPTYTTLKTQFVSGAPTTKFSLCDDEGVELAKKGTEQIIKVKKKDGSDQEVLIKTAAKFLDPNTGNLDFKSLTLVDAKSGALIDPKDLDLSKEIELHVLAKIPGSTYKFDVAHSKKLKFKLKDTTALDALDDAKQKARYDTYNYRGKPIGEYVVDHYSNHYKEIENKLIDDEIGDATSDEKKKILRDHIRTLIVEGNPFSPFVPMSKRKTILGDAFKKFLFKNVKPTDEDIATEASYDKFLNKNIPEQLKLFLDKELKKQLESTTDSSKDPNFRDLHTPLTNAILTFRQEQEERAKDARLDADALKGSTKPIKANKASTKKRRPEITRSGLWGIMGKKDVSYLRFFHDQSESISKQTLNIVTDEKDNKVENASYSGEIKVSTSHLQFTVNQEGEEPFTLQGGNQVKLIHAILNEPRIKYGKMRIHMAYGCIKALIKLANKNNLTLQSRKKGSKTVLESLKLDKNESIMLEERDDSNGRTNSTPIFSEKEFATNNDIHQLRGGLERCMEHVNNVMNATHKQYKKATEMKVLSYFSLTRSRFPATWLGSPIKKLMNIRSARTLNFDFDNVNVEGYNISFHKNKYTITGGELKKPLVSRNLGKLLRHREIGKRIFDGKELKINAAIYKQTVVQLRKNAKLANTNFGVKDPIKNRVYFVNTMGDVCFVPLANNKDPLKRTFTSLWMKKDYGEVKKGTPSSVASAQEAEEFYQNPFLMGKLMKAMNLGLYKF